MAEAPYESVEASLMGEAPKKGTILSSGNR